MRTPGWTASATGVLLCWGTLVPTAPEYPLTLVLDAKAETATASVAATVTISVERLMEESRRVRAADALKHGGYPAFLKVLRALAPVGTIGIGARQVDVRYLHEQTLPDGHRFVMAADRPLFFLGGDPEKSRVGYELTIVELTVDSNGGVSGFMAGAARVKPGGDGTVVLDDYAGARVRLVGRVRRP